ncbi:MAG: chorismate synthase [Eubacteriaceae bacterium]|nr:chorismate synthase [Eubacteriaceae bacterium]
MGNIWGSRFKVSIFGESHGPAIGVAIEGLAPGFQIEWDLVAKEMARRAPGQSELATQRQETDEWELLSGYFNGAATGTALCAIIRNTDTRSRDYAPELLRPSHADLSSLYKYGGYADYRGGGQFSGRLTAPIVFAGAIAKQALMHSGIKIGARIASIGGIDDDPASPESLPEISLKEMPVLSSLASEKMKQAIKSARDAGDSLGGIVECTALGVPGGWGDPFFDSLESSISSMMFSIPAVKAVEFGAGFAFSSMSGSQANDPLSFKDGQVQAATNHSGGINGGISNGMPILFRVAFRPTPTISITQDTVNVHSMQNEKASFGGRHDPCIAIRAVPVVEAGLAICLVNAKSEVFSLKNINREKQQ